MAGVNSRPFLFLNAPGGREEKSGGFVLESIRRILVWNRGVEGLVCTCKRWSVPLSGGGYL